MSRTWHEIGDPFHKLIRRFTVHLSSRLLDQIACIDARKQKLKKAKQGNIIFKPVDFAQC